MKKTTKSLWIYAAVLFIIAIALIITATLLQARVISPDTGEIEVLGTFTRDIKQSVTELTDENVNLTTRLHEATAQNEQLTNELDALRTEHEKELKNKETVKQIYAALEAKDYTALEPLLAQITADDADTYIEGLYDDAEKALNSNTKAKKD